MLHIICMAIEKFLSIEFQLNFHTVNPQIRNAYNEFASHKSTPRSRFNKHTGRWSRRTCTQSIMVYFHSEYYVDDD